jgi:hypothetical protein
LIEGAVWATGEPYFEERMISNIEKAIGNRRVESQIIGTIGGNAGEAWKMLTYPKPGIVSEEQADESAELIRWAANEYSDDLLT